MLVMDRKKGCNIIKKNYKMKKILLACEESQICTEVFRNNGINAYSCDIQKCSGNLPQYHIQDDVTKILKYNWDVIIGFPPCTDLSNAQSGKIMNEKIKQGKPQKALEFIKLLYNSCNFVCIENPVSSYLNNNWIPYSQIIEPYYFGHNYRKKTCLWLKNLPPLISTLYCYPKFKLINYSNKKVSYQSQKNVGLFRDAKNRSKFHKGVAEAMVKQWHEYLI